MRGMVTYQPKLDVVQFPGAPVVNGAGAATDLAKWRVAVNATLDWSLWQLSAQQRWRSSLKQTGNPTLVYDIADVPSVSYTDVSLTLRPNERTNIFLQVANLFDQQPPVFIIPGTSPGLNYPAVAGDDILGRYFTAGVRLRF